ncbi:MAG TPA: glutamine--tRNA ligase, partial [Flavobacterium sp.]|nr:glutamine--tRNA ligase [Flavobacterium sp.]
VPFTRELYIEREDFMENAPSKFFRLSIGREVRLKNAYIIKGENVVKDAAGLITEIHATYDPESLSGSGSEASLRKVSGTLHWVSVAHAKEAQVRLYDRLFLDEAPDSHKEKDFLEFVNPDSLKIVTGYVETSLVNVVPEEKFQFQRLGYFVADKDSRPGKPVFNRTVTLKDSWEEKGKKEENAINNALKEINRYFKADDHESRDAIEESVSAQIKSVQGYTLLQQSFAKNVNNTKSSLLFANWLLKYSSLRFDQVEKEVLHKFYQLSLKSESEFVRSAVMKNLDNDPESRAQFIA